MNRTNNPQKAIVDVDSSSSRSYTAKNESAAAARQNADRSEEMIERICQNRKDNQGTQEAHS